MRILHLGKYYPPAPGGIEYFVRDLAVEQARRGHEVAALVHQGTAGPAAAEGVAVHSVRVLGHLAHAPLSPGLVPALARLLREFKPHVLHLHLPNPSAFACLLHACLPILVIHWHADAASSAQTGRGGLAMAALYPLYRRCEAALLRRADAIIATSPPYLDASQPLAAVRAACHVAPLGLDQTRLPTSDALPRGCDRPLVLAVGRFAFYKGFEYLIEAAAQLPQADFCIVGDGPLWPALCARVRQAGLEGRVQLPGRLDEPALAALFGQCDVFCLPSIDRSEAFGLVLLEAMASGKPLVTTSIPGSGVGWVNVDHVTGLSVPPADANALAEAHGRLLNDPRLRERMGRAGKERFERLFRIEAVAAQIQDIYEGARGEPRP